MNDTQHAYTAIAYQRLGISEADWKPELGFKASEAILDKLYHYYQAVYLLQPDKFYWAGLARLTGGQVLYGMRNLTKIAKDPSVITQEIMATAKDIFDSIAWQHELFLADKDLLLLTCMTIDAVQQHTYSYYECWKLIFSDDDALVAKGNEMLLHNEQLDTIQKHYNQIKTDAYSRRYFWFTRFVMRCIHPYHSRFILQFPFGDVTRFADRWKWISNKKGMWPSWIAISREEKIRLVSLSNESVTRHRWK
jgi:hypothetical protein